MRHSQDLRKLHRSALERLVRLRSLAEDISLSRHVQVRDETVTYCVVELYNLWYGFSRALYLSSAFCARDGAGVKVALSRVARPASIEDALGVAIRRNKPNVAARGAPWNWWDEPAWESSRVLLNSLDELGASNYTQVSAALSLKTLTPVIAHAKKFRNFYAHRGLGTSNMLTGIMASYTRSSSVRPSEALLLPMTIRGVTRPQILLLDWLDDLGNIIQLTV